MKKDEIESLKSSLNKANEKIVSLQGDVEAYKLSGEQMGDEIKALKRQLGGLKTSNANYRKQVEQLKGLVEHYKALDKEGDELSEERIKTIEEKEKVIRGLQEQVNYLTQKNSKLATQLEVQREENTRLNNELKHAKMPWWRKIL